MGTDMKNSRRTYASIAFFCMVIALWFFWGMSQAYATDDCRGSKCGNVDVDVGGDTINVGGDTITGGDVSVPVNVTGGPVEVNHSNSSRALGLSNNMGDVDIAGCLGSTQWATPIYSKQKLVVNWVCLAEFYLRNDQAELAAMALCNTEVIKEFDDEEQCEAAHSFFANAYIESPVIVPDSSDEDEEYRDEMIQEQQAIIETQQQQLETVQERLTRLENTKRAATKVVNQVGLTDQQRAELAKVFGQ